LFSRCPQIVLSLQPTEIVILSESGAFAAGVEGPAVAVAVAVVVVVAFAFAFAVASEIGPGFRE
jgi:hypothetical protein